MWPWDQHRGDPAKTQDVDCLNVRLERATNEIISLKILNEARKEVAELKKGVHSKFWIEAIRWSDKDVQFYTSLPPAAVFDQLLEYLSPEGKRSNVVCHATAKRWADDCKDAGPGKAEWRESEAPKGRPVNLSANESFLMLVRLCLNLKEYDLTKRFEISQSSVSRIFTTWINYCYLHLGMLPRWPDRVTIKSTMPAIFKEQYPK